TRLRSLANALEDRLPHAAAGPVDVLPHFEHDHGDAAVLTNGQPLGRGNLVVPYELLECPPADVGFLAADRVAQRVKNVVRNVVVRFDDEPCDGLAQRRHFDTSYFPHLLFHFSTFPLFHFRFRDLSTNRYVSALVDHECPQEFDDDLSRFGETRRLYADDADVGTRLGLTLFEDLASGI